MSEEFLQRRVSARKEIGSALAPIVAALDVRTSALALLLTGTLWAGNFQFAILGDRTGEAVRGVYEQVWRDIATLRPEFVINVGDTIQGGHDETAASEWRAARAVWKPFHIPFYLVPGNHDIWSEPSRHVYERETGRPASYSFDHEGAHFTVLDNSRSLQLSDAQMKFLVADLNANQARHPKFVFFHQPFWLLSIMLGSKNFPFHDEMKKLGVDYVISGHVHQFSRFERDGVQYLMVGSSGGHLRGHNPAKNRDQGWYFGYATARVTGGKAEISFVETGPPFGQSRKQ